MEILSGFITEFEKAAVIHRDARLFGMARDALVDLTVRHGDLNVVEILIAGWDDDPRSIYEIPEARRWITTIRRQWPDVLLWLTPDSLRTCVLCLNPDMHERLPDGRLKIVLDTDRIMSQFTDSAVDGVAALVEAGLPVGASQRILEQAMANLTNMLGQKRLGDYVVVHPEHKTVVTYRD